jgi:tetratricopeptide (TPR) repeat protein
MSAQRSEETHKVPQLTNERATESVLDTLKANERVAEQEPARALHEMRDFLEKRGPHPQLLCRIAVLEQRLGQPEALRTAQEATRLALSVGNVPAMSELLVPFGEQWDELGVDPENWLKLANSQRGTGRTEIARRIYRRLLREDPRSLPAVKGLLQIADTYLKKAETTSRALEVFDELEDLAPQHPFDEYVEQGREEARRRLAPT